MATNPSSFFYCKISAQQYPIGILTERLIMNVTFAKKSVITITLFSTLCLQANDVTEIESEKETLKEMSKYAFIGMAACIPAASASVLIELGEIGLYEAAIIAATANCFAGLATSASDRLTGSNHPKLKKYLYGASQGIYGMLCIDMFRCGIQDTRSASRFFVSSAWGFAGLGLLCKALYNFVSIDEKRSEKTVIA